MTDQTESINERLIGWLCGNDTGASSRSIVFALTGREGACNVPFDEGDFGRCYRLLELIHEWKPRLHEVAERFPEWSAIVREWARLEEMYLDKLRWPDLYDAINELIAEGRIAAGWTQTSPHTWRGPTARTT